jgi:uncharacterized membrane protein YecN with MAPEG domain
MTASVIPVAFMLLYQYCTNKGKNFYIYTIILSLIFAYGLGSISKYLELFKMRKGTTLTYLFLIDIAVAFIAYWFTKFFLKLRREK